MKKLLPLIFIPIALLASSNVGDYLTSEEEILDALAREEINFTQYYDLVELFRDKVSIFSEELDMLLIVPGVDKRWIDALQHAVEMAGPYAEPDQIIRNFPYDFERIESFIIFVKAAKRDWRASGKIYSHGRFIDSDPYYPKTYFTTNGRYKGYDLNLRFHEDQDGFVCKRRDLEMEVFDGELVLGSYRKGFGPGMVLGKVFYIPGDMRENSTAESFLNPHDNMFNGFRYERESERVIVGALASRIVYDSVSANAFGLQLAWNPIERLNLGGVYSYSSTNSRPAQTAYDQSSGSVYAVGDWDEIELETELGFVENGSAGFMASAVIKIDDTRTLAEIWAYGNDFNPMNAKGISNYKQTYIDLEESGVTQRSREAGESGFEIRTTSPILPDFFLNTEGSGWRTPQIDEWGVYSEIGLYYRGEKGRRLRGDYSYEKRVDEGDFREKHTIRLRANWPLLKYLENSTYFRIRETITEDESVYGVSVYPEFIYSRYEPFIMRLRLKRYKSDLGDSDNGYWGIRFRNEVRTGSILWIGEVRHAIYDDGDDPLTEFRVTSAYYWR